VLGEPANASGHVGEDALRRLAAVAQIRPAARQLQPQPNLLCGLGGGIDMFWCDGDFVVLRNSRHPTA